MCCGRTVPTLPESAVPERSGRMGPCRPRRSRPPHAPPGPSRSTARRWRSCWAPSRSRRSRWAAPGAACWPSRSSPASPCRPSTTRRWTATPCARRTSSGRRTTARSRCRSPPTSRPGGRTSPPLQPGTAHRIMTGAPLPAGADAVVQVEHTDGGHDRVRVFQAPAPGTSVRRAGEDVTAGAVVLPAGTVLGAAQIGVAAAVGAATLPVRRRPPCSCCPPAPNWSRRAPRCSRGRSTSRTADARRRGGGRRRRRRAAAVRARRRRAPAPRARRAPGGRHRRPRPHLGRDQRGRLRGGQGRPRPAGASSSSRSRCNRAGRRAWGG